MTDDGHPLTTSTVCLPQNYNFAIVLNHMENSTTDSQPDAIHIVEKPSWRETDFEGIHCIHIYNQTLTSYAYTKISVY